MLNVFKSNTTPKKTMSEHAEDALYREVSEELRAQQAYDLARKHMRLLIAVAAAAVIIVIGVQLTKRHNAAALIESATAYESAVMMMEIDSPNPRAVTEALVRAAKKSRGGMADLALFSAARMDIQTGETEAGLEKLEQLAKRGATRDFRDLATLNLAMLRADEMTPREFQQFLAPVQTKRSPFYFTGLLLVAKKYLASDDPDAARIWIDRIITDKDAPATIAAQAGMLR